VVSVRDGESWGGTCKLHFVTVRTTDLFIKFYVKLFLKLKHSVLKENSYVHSSPLLKEIEH
jgi:hypothetical protein